MDPARRNRRTLNFYRLGDNNTLEEADPALDLTQLAAARRGPAAHGINVVRNQLFYTMLEKFALGYVQHSTPLVRRLIEFAFLLFAMSCLFVLLYVHVFISTLPNNCLNELKDNWPRKGIIRVEIVKSWAEYHSYLEQQEKLELDTTHFSLKDVFLHGPNALPSVLRSKKRRAPPTPTFTGESELYIVQFMINISNFVLHPFKSNFHVVKYEGADEEAFFSSDGQEQSPSEVGALPGPNLPASGVKESPVVYVVEYSMHHGLLRLPTEVREHYDVPVAVVVISADDESQCVGSYRKQGLLRLMVGYDDVLINSFRALVENETEKGYLHDMVRNVHYHFVAYESSKLIFVTALFVMLLFTFATSMLLRFSHHQIFLFIVDLLHMFEVNQPLVFPIAPLLTVILALVGMETIMSEIFSDTTTAFYVILVVWVADQYDAICCHSHISRKYWLRFFYLYHFSFYLYHYRFYGQFTGCALLTSAAFVVHSMIYFFHHYELPVILYTNEIHRFTTRLHNQSHEALPPATSPPTGNNNGTGGQTGLPTPATTDLALGSPLSRLTNGQVSRAVYVRSDTSLAERRQILIEAERLNMWAVGSRPTAASDAPGRPYGNDPSIEQFATTEAESLTALATSTAAASSSGPGVPPEVVGFAEELVRHVFEDLFGPLGPVIFSSAAAADDSTDPGSADVRSR